MNARCELVQLYMVIDRQRELVDHFAGPCDDDLRAQYFAVGSVNDLDEPAYQKMSRANAALRSDGHGVRILEMGSAHDHIDADSRKRLRRLERVHAVDRPAHPRHDPSEIDLESRLDGIDAEPIGAAQVRGHARGDTER